MRIILIGGFDLCDFCNFKITSLMKIRGVSQKLFCIVKLLFYIGF